MKSAKFFGIVSVEVDAIMIWLLMPRFGRVAAPEKSSDLGNSCSRAESIGVYS